MGQDTRQSRHVLNRQRKLVAMLGLSSRMVRGAGCSAMLGRAALRIAPLRYSLGQFAGMSDAPGDGNGDSGVDADEKKPTSRKSTLFSTPKLGGHGHREGGLKSRIDREDEDLRKALEEDAVGQVKMQCLACDKDTDEYDEVRLRCCTPLCNVE